MLYIIEMMASDSFDNPTVFKNIIKIGYTRNFDKRIKGYYTHNPFFRVIKLFEGDEFDQTCEKIKPIRGMMEGLKCFLKMRS